MTHNGTPFSQHTPSSSAPSNAIVDAWRLLSPQLRLHEHAGPELLERKGKRLFVVEFRPGAIATEIRIKGIRPFTVSLELEIFEPEQWDELIRIISSDSRHVAQLLEGRASRELLDELEAASLALLPRSVRDVRIHSDCPPGMYAHNIDRIIAQIEGELAHAPLQILTVHGMPPEQVIERLRQSRVLQTHGMATAHADPFIPESQVPPPDLELCLDDFWRCGGDFAHLRTQAMPEFIPHALLRRLGPSPLEGRFPLVGLLASIYDTVSEKAIRMRETDE